MLQRLVLVTLFITLSSKATACTKILRWNDDPPFSFISAAHPTLPIGINIDVVREILSEMDCSLELTKMPWARALEALKAGKIDMVGGAFRTAERDTFALFSSKDFQSPNRLFQQTAAFDRWQVGALADIEDSEYRLGVQIGVSYSSEFERLRTRAGFEKQLVAVNERESLWKMLAMGRIDGVIADELTARAELNSLGLGLVIGPTDLIVADAPSYFAFSRETTSPEFVEAFSELLENMQNDGNFDAILERYLD
ncbi:substrate-binding periplasmic protein [Allohahella marinimesophila]|uniref:Transporter substrate-binding domain-containing protein n=1 Tax=Allohahella marinimesophila TaxID=1054972 RepID=A0ABP7NW24_9GAMM